ncbi:hypothetical protein HSB1_21810 [Halogranum salarium B-1]|uniref:Uncharacterized protein n=1 Tax=Halogranum salarium B-1 TaxID=1210908 RepID=J3A3P0_9EURY|nr:hypothetical protein HSB1_21810 [Halogranum salarium B-1]
MCHRFGRRVRHEAESRSDSTSTRSFFRHLVRASSAAGSGIDRRKAGASVPTRRSASYRHGNS